MRTGFKIFSALVILTGIITLSSCTKTCDLGYEGDHCSTLVKTKYLGTFSGRQTCGSVTDTFSVVITEITGDITKVKINNIYNASLNTTATLLDNGSFSIGSQPFGSAAISGSMASNSGKINISFVVSGGGLPPDNCTWVQN